jgi:hypothetical protein
MASVSRTKWNVKAKKKERKRVESETVVEDTEAAFHELGIVI